MRCEAVPEHRSREYLPNWLTRRTWPRTPPAWRRRCPSRRSRRRWNSRLAVVRPPPQGSAAVDALVDGAERHCVACVLQAAAVPPPPFPCQWRGFAHLSRRLGSLDPWPAVAGLPCEKAATVLQRGRGIADCMLAQACMVRTQRSVPQSGSAIEAP